MRPPAQCALCAHWRGPTDPAQRDGKQTCTAYPDGIPDNIWRNRLDHRQPQDGDHGIRWEADGDAEFPQWAMNLES